MAMLSDVASQELVDEVIERIDKVLTLKAQSLSNNFPYIQQRDLKKKLGISSSYLSKLEAHGLKRIQLEEGDRTVFYSLAQLAELFEENAE